jgi:hypothetical protein
VVINRQCHERPGTKPRPPWFDKAAAFESVAREASRIIVVYDFPDDVPSPPEHLAKASAAGHRVLAVRAGSDAMSLFTSTNVALRELDDDDIVYFVEDDYMHRPGWARILREAFEHGVGDYVTLYDHPDKYDPAMYPTLTSRVLCSPSTHWRTVPSTTNTFATRMRTLRSHLHIHEAFMTLMTFTDHEKFLALGAAGATIVSAVPAWSTHCHEPLVSATVDWAAVAAAVGTTAVTSAVASAAAADRP